MDRVIHMVNTSGKSEEAKMRKSHKAFQITHSRTVALFAMQFSSFVQNHACRNEYYYV